jgi:quercetin 2,3-dioxygenase
VKASDIMTSPVVSVGPDASLRQVAALLSERRISGVPVLEDERLVGLVSQADLLRRRRSGAQAGRARDIMTHEVMTVSADTPVAEVAALLEGYGIKRVPVLEEGRLVGIVSRSNLVQALAVQGPLEETQSDDDAIRAALLAALERQPWWGSESNVIVAGGVVHYWGATRSEDLRAAACAIAQSIPGVRRVEDHRFTVRERPVSTGPAGEIRRASQRGHSKHGGVEAWHSFSFGNYYDPARMGCGPLRAINEKLVRPGAGSTTYGLRDVEVIAYGVRFSETNGSESQASRFLQIWLEPDRLGVPASYEHRQFSADSKRGRLCLIASPDGRDGSLRINQNALLHAALFDGPERAQLEVAPGRLAYAQVACGAITVQGQALGAGDGFACAGGTIALEEGRNAEVLVFDLPHQASD